MSYTLIYGPNGAKYKDSWLCSNPRYYCIPLPEFEIVCMYVFCMYYEPPDSILCIYVYNTGQKSTKKVKRKRKSKKLEYGKTLMTMKTASRRLVEPDNELS